LSGSRVKEYEEEFNRIWQEQQQQRDQPSAPAGALNLHSQRKNGQIWVRQCQRGTGSGRCPCRVRALS
jgi:hypothetical protein